MTTPTPPSAAMRPPIPSDAHEVRRNEDGTVDEVVGFGFLHIEQMSATHWWIGFDTADGRLLHLRLWAKGTIKLMVEEQGQSDLVHRRDARALSEREAEVERVMLINDRLRVERDDAEGKVSEIRMNYGAAIVDGFVRELKRDEPRVGVMPPACPNCEDIWPARLADLKADYNERLRQAEASWHIMDNAHEQRMAAKDAALQFAEGAIDDAIYTESGLDGVTGEKVLHICREAREAGTFDQQPFDRSKLPSILVETLRAQLCEREATIARLHADWHTLRADLSNTEAQLRECEREVERLREALGKIAAWNEGAQVTGSFDEPEAARIARTVLKEQR